MSDYLCPVCGEQKIFDFDIQPGQNTKVCKKCNSATLLDAFPDINSCRMFITGSCNLEDQLEDAHKKIRELEIENEYLKNQINENV